MNFRCESLSFFLNKKNMEKINKYKVRWFCTVTYEINKILIVGIAIPCNEWHCVFSTSNWVLDRKIRKRKVFNRLSLIQLNWTLRW